MKINTQMMNKKIDAMHNHYGYSDGICGDCPHFIRFRYHDKVLLKCRAYGLTHSEATDWRVKWPACGQKEHPLPEDHKPVFDLIKGQRENTYKPIEGQISMEEMLIWKETKDVSQDPV